MRTPRFGRNTTRATALCLAATIALGCAGADSASGDVPDPFAPTDSRSTDVPAVDRPCLQGCDAAAADGPDVAPGDDAATDGGGGDVGPVIPEEICGNGIDDNADGQADEDCACAPGSVHPCFVGAPERAGVGACVWGTQRCAGTGLEGVWGACTGSGAPSAGEACDGADNNCDGAVDEGCACPTRGTTRGCYTGPAGTAGRGACRAGVQTCAGTGGTQAWGPCVGEVLPGIERCDGMDRDCDGSATNGCACAVGRTASCYDGPTGTTTVGACRAGTSTCAVLPGGGSAMGPCVGAAAPGGEDCDDGIDGDCDGALDCADSDCAGHPACVTCRGGTATLMQPHEADVVLLVDKSGSMAEAATDGATRWTALRSALDRVLPRMEARLDLGLAVFPASGACGVATGRLTVPIRPMNSATIRAILRVYRPDGDTPTVTVLADTESYLNSTPSARPRYLVLATDGEPNCGGPVSSVVARLMALSARGVPTFVLGIPGANPLLRASLNQMAMAGGRPRAGGTSFYEAVNTEQLSAAMRAISAAGASCVYALDTVPMNPARLHVTFNGAEVARDPVNGWSFTDSSNREVRFNGAACTRLGAGNVVNVTALDGCM